MFASKPALRASLGARPPPGSVGNAKPGSASMRQKYLLSSGKTKMPNRCAFSHTLKFVLHTVKYILSCVEISTVAIVKAVIVLERKMTSHM